MTFTRFSIFFWEFIFVIFTFPCWALADDKIQLPEPSDHIYSAVHITRINPYFQLREELDKIGLQAFTAPNYKPRIVKYTIVFRYLKTTTVAQQEEVRKRFMELKEKAKRNGHQYIVSIQDTMQNDLRWVDKKSDQCFTIIFHTEGDRNYFVGTPVIRNPNFYDTAYQEFKEFAAPFLKNNDRRFIVLM